MPNIIPALSTYNVPDRDRWVPNVRAGHFFIGDRRYYLYADKACLRLEQCRRMRFTLVGDPYGDVTVDLDGVPYTNFVIEANEAVVDLQDIETHIAYWGQFSWDDTRWGYFDAGFILTDDTQVTFTYNTLVWNATTHQFDVTAIVQHARFRDAEEEYWLPEDLIPNTPVVITDDSKLATDQRDYAIEYDVAPDGRITFNAPRNYVPNPNFDVAPTGSPSIPVDWLLSDPANIQRYQGTGYIGQWVLRFANTTGKARAMIDVAANTPLGLSVYARMDGTGSRGTAYLEAVYKTSAGDILSTAGAVIGADPDPGPYSIRNAAELSGRDWQRVSIIMGPDDDLEPTDGVIPTGVAEIEVRLWGQGTGSFDFDAVQLERNKFVSQHGYIGPASTVEFEQDPTGIYAPNLVSHSWPFPELNHVDLNAASEDAHGGFLFMEEFGDASDTDLDVGGVDDTDPTGVPRGIVPRTGVFWRFGRRNLPYARMCGRTKLRHRYPLRLENQPYVDPVNQYQTPREPVSVLIVPPDNTRRDSNDVLHASISAGEDVTASAIFRDSVGNPVMHERVQITVSGTGSVTPSEAFTNDGGRVLCSLLDAPVLRSSSPPTRWRSRTSRTSMRTSRR
jgi:hypothetical protein